MKNGRRFLAYTIAPGPRSTQPVVRSEMINGTVCCYVYTFISANARTAQPKLLEISNTGPVFWLNPDGTRLRLDKQMAEQVHGAVGVPPQHMQ